MHNYPLQTAFQLSLHNAGLATITIHNYDHSISQLFAYLAALHNDGPVNVDDVTDNDLRSYINYLRQADRLNDRTYNKLISQLNRYFRFCFSSGFSHRLPTLELHGHAQPKKSPLSFEWLTKLPIILADDQVHFYTRLTILLCAHGYTSQEFLQPGFYHELKNIALTKTGEKEFINNFHHFIRPLQLRQGVGHLFLKQRYNPKDPWLSAPALHKYLAHDRVYLGFNINPSDLHRSYILYHLQAHTDWTDQQLMTQLRLDPSSLLYYRRLLLKQQ